MDEKQKKEYFLKGNGYYLDEYELAKALTRPKTLADIEYEQQLDDYLAKQQENPYGVYPGRLICSVIYGKDKRDALYTIKDTESGGYLICKKKPEGKTCTSSSPGCMAL